MAYQIEILDNNLVRQATITNPPALSKDGYFLEFSQKLSAWGEARFRVATHDPLFAATGDILRPLQNHVRIKHNNAVVFQGVIVKNQHRTKNYIEVLAYSYLYLLNIKRIVHDASVTAGDNLDNYLTMNSGTMASQVTAMVTKAIAGAGVGPLSRLTIGTVENPQFPAGYTGADGTTALTGAWTFSPNLLLQYSYIPVFKAISTLGIYGKADLEITNDFVFNFKLQLGNIQTGLVLSYGSYGGMYGNIEDFNLPLDGVSMANDLVGIATDTGSQVFHTVKQDTASIATYGPVEGVAAFGDVKDKNTLVTRLLEELVYVADPINDISLTLNSQAPPLGQYGVGDTVTVRIKTPIYDVNSPRKIVGIFAKIHVTGKENVRVVVNEIRS